MTGAHLHLLANHAPILGAVFAVVLLLVSMHYGGEVLLRTALALLLVVGVAAAAAKFTGDPAEEAVHGMPGVTHAAIHTLSALVASVAVSGLMVYAGPLGGQIRHTEVRPGATAADAIVIEPERAHRVETPAPNTGTTDSPSR